MIVLTESALFRRTPAVPAKSDPGGPEIRLVSRDYLKVIGISVVAGRGFEGHDGEGAARVLLINETFARTEFANRNPVGSRVFVGPDSMPWEIVGVVRDVRQMGFDRPPGPQIFALVNQWPGHNAFPLGPYFLVRTRLEPLAAVSQVRAAVTTLDAEAGLFNVATMESIAANALSRPRLYAALLGTFGALAGVLALIGIYGVISYAVSQRTREIGVRMALGARARDVFRLVLGHSLVVTSCGVAAGLAGAALLTGYMRGMLFGVEPLDVVTFTAVTACFVATAGAASYIPARRAAKVDPVRALRWE